MYPWRSFDLTCSKIVCPSRLLKDGRKAIKELGSALIDNIAFRDNYVIVGRRGLAPGKALEKVCVS